MVPPQNEEMTPDQGQVGAQPPSPAGDQSGSAGPAGPQAPKMPNMPTNPLSGDKFHTSNGGL